MMTINEYILIGNLVLSVILVHRIIKINTHVSILAEWLVIAMSATNPKYPLSKNISNAVDPEK